jgi:putative transposase
MRRATRHPAWLRRALWGFDQDLPMPRRARLRAAGIPWHIVHRGHDRQRCFFAPEDNTFYLNQLARLSKEHGCQVHAYVLMTNHVHLLVTPETEQAASRLMKELAQRVTQRTNKARSRSGSLWEGRFRSSLIEAGRYLLACYRYIELNPVRAGLVTAPHTYPWSSYRANAQGEFSPLITPHEVYLALAPDPGERLAAYQGLFGSEIDRRECDFIRERTHGGFAIASPDYALRLANAAGSRASPERRQRVRRMF